METIIGRVDIIAWVCEDLCQYELMMKKCLKDRGLSEWRLQ